jgi:RNA polymerase sigma-70 factor (ECF subfamily)
MDKTSVYIFSTSDNLDDKKGILTDLVKKAKKGDQAAFGDIYNQFFQKIYRFIYFRVSHKEVAEDLAEEVFLKVYGKIAGINNAEAFEGWLYEVARNSVVDYYRQKKITIALDEVENILEYENNIVDSINLGQDQKLLLGLIKDLPKEQQIVIKLKFLEDMDTPVIAVMLHKSEGAIRVIQHRAIIKLRELLKKHLTDKS